MLINVCVLCSLKMHHNEVLHFNLRHIILSFNFCLIFWAFKNILIYKPKFQILKFLLWMHIFCQYLNVQPIDISLLRIVFLGNCHFMLYYEIITFALACLMFFHIAIIQELSLFPFLFLYTWVKLKFHSMEIQLM